MHSTSCHLRHFLLFVALFNSSGIFAQSGFYKCEVKGKAPVYQDFPCMQGKGTAIYSASPQDDLTGLIKHGYYVQAQKYAQEHGITDSQLRTMMSRVARQHEAAENENQRIANQRRRQAEYDEQVKQERAIESLNAGMNVQSSSPNITPAQERSDENELSEEPHAQAPAPWTPGPPTYDPQHNRWCQADSPNTMHCW